MEGRRAWIESWPANEDFLIDACGFHEHMAYTKMGNGPEVEKAIATLFAPKKPLSSGKIVVSEAPKFDLDSYIANYKGKTRVWRLLHIGEASTYLQHEALKLAVAETKLAKDVGLYEKAVEKLHELIPNDSDGILDHAWVERTRREVTAETNRLEGELKGYKNNLIKESIRMGYDDIGKHYQQIGQRADAVKAFNKEREYCQLPAHIAIMNSRLINVGIEVENWLSVETNVQKLRALPQKPADSEKIEAKLSAALGLAELAMGNFRKAAQTFLECNPRMVQARLDDLDSEEGYNEVMTPNDVATYGALCALASMDRKELQTNVLENSNFRNYLELEPHLRRAISSFVSGRYAKCLDILQSYRTDYLLDLYLSPHYDIMYILIRNKAIRQYLQAFSSIRFTFLANTFSIGEDKMVAILVDLIKAGLLNARLDMEFGLLREFKVDERSAMEQETQEVVDDYYKDMVRQSIRIDVIQAGLQVKAPSAKINLSNVFGDQGSDTLMTLDPNVRGKSKGFMNRFFP